jgi:hypothetical protein
MLQNINYYYKYKRIRIINTMNMKSYFSQTINQSSELHIVLSNNTKLMIQFAIRIINKLILRTKIRLHIEYIGKL